MGGQPNEQQSSDLAEPAPLRGRELIDAYLARFGTAVGAELQPLDEGGYSEVRHEALIIGINADSERGLLMLLVRMGDLPRAPTPELYRTLLEQNFVATGPCCFSIDEAKGTVYLRILRQLAGLDYVEFETLLQSIAHVAADMCARVPALSYLQR